MRTGYSDTKLPDTEFLFWAFHVLDPNDKLGLYQNYKRPEEQVILKEEDM